MSEFTIINTELSNSSNQSYNNNDLKLLKPLEINNIFNSDDVVEFHIYNSNGDIVNSNYNFQNYRIFNNNLSNGKIQLYPNEDIKSYGYEYGEYNLLYNFNRNLFNSSYNTPFFIKEISPSRTEIKLSSTYINFDELQKLFIEYTINKNSSDFYNDFNINLGNNITFIGINIALDNNPQESNIFIKLYQPLPSDISIKDTLWINEVVSDPYSFKLTNQFQYINDSNKKNQLKGPNFNIDINEHITSTTQYLNLSNIIDSSSLSSFNYVESLLKDNININIDYNDFSNFIHFSSAQERIENFIYKINQINLIEDDINILTNISSSQNISSSIITLNNKKNNIIQNFDGYENFLYYESGTNSFPKQNSTKPYINLDLTHTSSLTWIGSNDESSQYYGGILLSASLYDDNNRDYLYNNLPDYIKEDSQNEKIKLFSSMIGHYYDYIWTYIKDITNKNDNDNRLNFGISKDLIGETLKSLGIKLYTNSRNNEDIYFSLLGINSDGTYLPSTGSLHIDNLVTSSLYSIPNNDINKEIYKRIYHNISYLLKTKGTKTGLRALINCFGIPKTILDIKEFGGVVKDNNDIEQITEKFNYSLNLNGTGSIKIPHYQSNQRFIDSGDDSIKYDQLEFRIKFNSNIEYPQTQSILINEDTNLYINIHNEGDGYGSIHVKAPNLPITTDNIELLPLYKNDDWWSISFGRKNNIGVTHTNYVEYNEYQLLIGNKNDWGIEYLHSQSFSGLFYPSFWTSPDTSNIIGPIEANIQEYRCRIGEYDIQDFKNFILNPKSYTYTNESESLKNIIFRIPFGSELDKVINNYMYSVHYNSTGSFIDSDYFQTSSRCEILNSSSVFYEKNYETYYINSPNIGENVESNNKIKILEEITNPDNTLSPNNTIIRTFPDISNNSNDIEIGYSPSDSINNDIINQLGNFNIDNYIGDPLDSGKSNYPKLDILKNNYFKKYIQKQNIYDLTKMLSYFENSLFKMIKDFTPFKSNLSTGLIIKSPILERNKIKRFEPIINLNALSTSSINMGYIEGGDPSAYSGSNITTNKCRLSPLGLINEIINDNRELYDGEYKNSNITINKIPSSSIIYESSMINMNNSNNDVFWFNIPLDPIKNVITGSRLNKRKLKVDYFGNINSPSNINYLSSSLLNNVGISFLYSEIQPTNNYLQRHIIPRYLGSKLISDKLNEYTDGDISYGKSSNINDNKIKFAYFEEITSQSSTLPGRSDMYIKYLIDTNSNIINLSNKNENIFEVQSLFNVDDVDIILDNNLSPSDQRKLDGTNKIFSGGFKYTPILQNIANEFTPQNTLDFIYEKDLELLNEDGVLPISNLPSNALILDNIKLSNDPIIQPQNLNDPASTLLVNINSPLKIDVERNTIYTGEIRLKLTGSILIKASISPPSNLIGTAFNRAGSHQGNFPIPLEKTNVNTIASDNDWNFTPWDNIGGAILPVGTQGFFYNTSTHLTTILNGNGGYQSVNTSHENGVDYMKATINGTSVLQNIHNLYNNLGDVPDISTINDIVSPLDEDDGVFVELLYPIEGYIILPAGVNNGEIILKNIQNQTSLIKGTIQFIATESDAVIKFTESPSLIPQPLYNQGSPFYYNNPPEYLYITGSQDYGYNSGSISVDNWYFERHNSLESGSFNNKLIGSFYLSNIIYNELVNRDNNIIQVLEPTSSFGFENIENYFQPKIGDLVRLYNHDKKQFQNNFENEIKNIILPTSPPVSGTYNNRFILELVNEIPNQACSDYFVSGSESKKISNFIILSKKNNETNIIIKKTKNKGETSSGIILPSNLSPDIKEEAGNIVKTLKSQNLIN